MPLPTDVLGRPAVADLEPRRRALLRERFLYRTWLIGTVVTCYVNLFVGLVGGLYLQLSPTPLMIGVGLVALTPLTGLYFANRYKSGRVRAVGRAVRERLEIEQKVRSAWFGLLVILVLLGGLLYLGPTNNQTLGVMCLVLALYSPWGRWRNDPHVQRWVLAFMSLWMVLAAGLLFGLEGVLGTEQTFWVGVVWMMGFPGGLPAVMLRRPITAALDREDVLGRMARAFSPLLPAPQRAAAARIGGQEDQARAMVVERFKGFQSTQLMGEGLLELATLEDDPEARQAWLAGAMLLLADHPEPFAAMARELRDTGDREALHFAEFAENNATRALTFDADTYAALRMELSELPAP